MTIIRRTLVAAVATLAVTVALGVLALALIDWNIARPWISTQVKERNGRDLALEGDPARNLATFSSWLSSTAP